MEIFSAKQTFSRFGCLSILALVLVALAGCSEDDMEPTVQAPAAFDFEDGLVPEPFIEFPDKPWIIKSGGAGGSNFSMRSGDISSSLDIISKSHTETCFRFNVVGGAGLVFDLRVSSEAGADFLYFDINGTRRNEWSGEVAWHASMTYPLSGGSDAVTWCYDKDWALFGGQDRAEIDNIVIN